jgi:cupin fold WbuC family metalloprotein
MIRIDKHLLDKVSAQARTAPRRRMNHNFHQTPEDLLNRMLNAMEPDTYVQPHKHQNPDKREAFIVLRGSFLIVEFNEAGQITDHVILGNQYENYGLEIPPRTYHTLISLEEGSVIYELKDGPYIQQTDKIFAPWAPTEGSPSCQAYNKKLLEQLEIKMH